MPRLFTALELPDDVADELALNRGGLFGAHWLEPDDYHITLRFMGDIDARLAFQRFENRAGKFIPCMRFAGTEIEKTIRAWLGREVQCHIYGILDVEEIAFLFAVGVIGTMTFEQTDRAGLKHLRVTFIHQAAHVAFVIFVGPEDVEIFQAHDVRQPAFFLRDQIELMFRIAVWIERMKAREVRFRIAHARSAIAVRRR